MYAKKVEYLKGLMAGLSLDPGTNEYKLFTAVIDALDAFSGALSDVEEDVNDLEDTLDGLNDEMDAISDLMDDLAELEGDEEDNVRPFPGTAAAAEDEDYDDSGEYEVTCRVCNHVFVVDEETLFEGKVPCPSCKETLSFDIGGCGCGHCRDDQEKDDG
jgi:rubrerythrin